MRTKPSLTAVHTVTVSADDDGIRLDRWFKRHYPAVSHITLEKALRKGEIRINGKRAKASARLEAGQSVRVPPLKVLPESEKSKPKATPKKIDPKQIAHLQRSVIYKDQYIIAINKPHGLAVQGGNKVSISVDAMLDHLKFDSEERPKLVHRLDKDTSGVLILARSTVVAGQLGELFRHKDIEKHYWALTVGVPSPLHGTVDLPLAKGGSVNKEKVGVSDDGKRAITHYRVLDKAGKDVALVELNPVTGRTHQLRAHMMAIQTPILGDGKYGGKLSFVQGLGNLLHLHARQVILPDFMGKRYVISAPLPSHMKRTFETLGFSEKPSQK